jgi:hypothetical protein
MHGEKKDYDHHGEYSSSIRHRSCRSPDFRGTDLQPSIVTVELDKRRRHRAGAHTRTVAAGEGRTAHQRVDRNRRATLNWPVISDLKGHAVVSHDEQPRGANRVLAKEKEFTRLGGS